MPRLKKSYSPSQSMDTRLPAKEIMYIVNFNDHSIAFKVRNLKLGAVATVDVGKQKLTGKIMDREITVTTSYGKVLPGYHAMWFSWAIFHRKDGVVWGK